MRSSSTRAPTARHSGARMPASIVLTHAHAHAPPTLLLRSGALAERTGSEKTPAVYIRGQLVSGLEVKRASKSGELAHWTDAGDEEGADGAEPLQLPDG